MRVRFHPEARRELLQSQVWYESRSPLAAAAFAREFSIAIDRIAESPERYPTAEHGTRRLILHRFPFNIFYRIGQGEVVIVAVAHQKRRPGYWAVR